MTCHYCKTEAVKAGFHKSGVQRWKCQQCGKRFQDAQQKPFGADSRLPKETICRILHCLVEGNSVRGTAVCAIPKSARFLAFLRWLERLANVSLSKG